MPTYEIEQSDGTEFLPHPMSPVEAEEDGAALEKVGPDFGIVYRVRPLGSEDAWEQFDVISSNGRDVPRRAG